LNEVGYNAASAGNHDFDLGKDVFINLTKIAQFPILSANLLDITTEKVFFYVKPYTIVERGSLKIGIFGMKLKLRKT